MAKARGERTAEQAEMLQGTLDMLVLQALSERTREIGIRLALGATAVKAIRAVALPGVLLALVGTAIGTALAALFLRLARHFI